MNATPQCPYCRISTESADPRAVVRSGFFKRLEDGRRIQRYLCKSCKRTMSNATFSPCYRQHKRRINRRVGVLLCEKVNHSAIVRIQKINKRTVVAKRRFLARRAHEYLLQRKRSRLLYVQFDEMQSSIHTKCKPVSIPMAVDASTREILAFDVVSMPAQHPLKEISLRKYGPRTDDRAIGIASVLTCIEPMLHPQAQIVTDRCPRYPAPIRKLLPGRQHVSIKGRKSSAGGQGELKKIGFDPIFSFNHTAAMVRDHVSRLVRKTWANSKRQDALREHLLIYTQYHNTVLLPKNCPEDLTALAKAA